MILPAALLDNCRNYLAVLSAYCCVELADERLQAVEFLTWLRWKVTELSTNYLPSAETISTGTDH